MGDLAIKETALAELDGAQRVELSGAIDGASITDLQDFVDQIYKDGARWFIVDMSGIKYVNSTGLGSLVKYADLFKNRGGGMVLYSVPPKVKVIIKMLGLDSFFPISNSLEEALEEARKTESGGAGEIELEDSDEGEKMMARGATTAKNGAAQVGDAAALSTIMGTLLEESRRTNRLLKGVILELRQLRADFEDDDDD